MVVAHVNTQSNQNNAGATTLSVTKPTGLANGHVMIATVVTNNGTNNITAIPTGFTLIGTVSDATNATTLHVSFKSVTNAAGEPASYSYTFSASTKAAAAITAYSGAHATSPIEPESVVFNPNIETNALTYGANTYNNTLPFMYFAAAQSTTASYTFAGANGTTMTERADITSGGGGGANTKVALGIADSNNPRQLDVGGNFEIQNDYVVSSTATQNLLLAKIFIRDANSVIRGPATTSTIDLSLIELRQAPVQFTDGVEVTLTDFIGGSRVPNHASLCVPYEVIGQDRVLVLYSEYQGTNPREQEAYAKTFSAVEDYAKFGEVDGSFLIQAQSIGATGIDTARISDNKFLIYYGNGHAFSQTGSQTSFWVDGPDYRIVEINGTTITSIGSGGVFSAGDVKPSRLESCISSGPNHVLFTGDYDSGTFTTGAVRALWFNGTSWVLGNLTILSNVADDGEGYVNAAMASHIDGEKFLIHYGRTTTGMQEIRVGTISDNGSGQLTQISLGSRTVTSRLSNDEILSKPVALNSTEGFLVTRGNASFREIAFTRYSISGTNVSLGSEYIAFSSQSDTRQYNYAHATKIGDIICLAVAWQDYGDPQYHFLDVKYFVWNESLDEFTLLSEENVFSNMPNGSQVLNPFITAGEGNRFFLRWYPSGSRLPEFQAMEAPTPFIETSRGAYIVGAPPEDYELVLDKNLGSVPLAGGTGAELIFAISDTQGCYIGGQEQQEVSTSAFSYGRDFIVGSTPAHVTALTFIIEDQEQYCHIVVAEPISDNTSAFAWGNQPISDNTSLFSKGHISLSDSQNLFLRGPNEPTPVFDVGPRVLTYGSFTQTGCQNFSTNPNIQVTSPAPEYQVQTWDSVNQRVSWATRRENSVTITNAGHFWSVNPQVTSMPRFKMDWRITFSDLEQFAANGRFRLGRDDSFNATGNANKPHIEMYYTWDTDESASRAIRGRFWNGTTLYQTALINVSVNVTYAIEVYIDPAANQGVIKVNGTKYTTNIVNHTAFNSTYDRFIIPQGNSTSGGGGINDSYALGWLDNLCTGEIPSVWTANDAYISADVFGAVRGYIVNYDDDISDDQDLFTYGFATGNIVQQAHISSVFSIADNQSAFIQAGTISDTQNLYIPTAEPSVDNTFAYIFSTNSIDRFKDCFINGEQIVVAPVGAIRFNRTMQEYLRIPDSTNTRPSSRFTLNFWMKGYDAANDANRGAWMEKMLGGSNRTIGIYEGPAGTQKWHFGINTGTWAAQDSVGSWLADVWYMVTLTYDETTVRFYVNAVLDSSFARTGNLNWSADDWRFAYRQETGEYLNMSLSKIKLWSYDLSPAEIQALYRSPSLYDAQGAFIEGRGFVPFFSEPVNLYTVSNVGAGNPLTQSSFLNVDIANASQFAIKRCYIVGAEVLDETHDVVININNFDNQLHDMVIRVGGQGERALTALLGDIEYPITRQARRVLENVFFPDMPGKIFGVQLSYIHGGWRYDTVSGDLSGGENGPAPAPRKAMIVSGEFTPSFTQAYLHGRMTSFSSSRNCFINNNSDVFSTAAYIHVNELVQEEFYTYAYIQSVAPSLVDNTACYISGIDSQNSGIGGYIPTSEFQVDFTDAFISAGTVIPIATNQDQNLSMHIVAGAEAFDPPIRCYMFGVFVAVDGQNAFLHTQPTVIDSNMCYISAPTPFIANQPIRMYMRGAQGITDGQNLFLQSTLNIINNTSAFTYGKDVRISIKRAFITNYPIFNLSDNTRAYVHNGFSLSDAQGAYISGMHETDVQHAYISNFDNVQNQSKTKRAYIVGPAITPTAKLCYIFGHNGASAGGGGSNGQFVVVYIEGG